MKELPLLLFVTALISSIVSVLTARYYILKYSKLRDKAEKEYVDRMVEETLKIINYQHKSK